MEPVASSHKELLRPALLGFYRGVEVINNAVAQILKWFILLLLAVLLFDSIARTFFNAPGIWVNEASAFIFGAYYLGVGGYVLMQGEHIRMDALYSRWSPTTKTIIDVITFPIIAVYLVMFLTGGIDNAAEAIALNQHSSSLWAPPLAPIKLFIVLSVILLLLASLALFLQNLFFLFKGRQLQ